MIAISLKTLLFILLNRSWNTSLTCQFVLNCKEGEKSSQYRDFR